LLQIFKFSRISNKVSADIFAGKRNGFTAPLLPPTGIFSPHSLANGSFPNQIADNGE
jgi:hypothetical protein